VLAVDQAALDTGHYQYQKIHGQPRTWPGGTPLDVQSVWIAGFTAAPP
jgi:hypothetical protein